MTIKRKIIRTLLFVLTIACFTQTASSQGSIFGQVTNFDLTVPANGEISFVGFIKGTDDEIRIESVDGAGYDNGFWLDDFQNYVGESSGDQFEYLFFNTSNNSGFHLSGQIPSNSFQQEDVPLSSINWPEPPLAFSGFFDTDSSIVLSWAADGNLNYHVYRRISGSSGSFFRIDNPGGVITGTGVAGSSFKDTTVSSQFSYDYLVISKDAQNLFSPHSNIITVTYSAYCCQLRGDLDNSGEINIADLSFLIRYLFKNGEEPQCFGNADVAISGEINIVDLTHFITYFFKDGPPLPDC